MSLHKAIECFHENNRLFVDVHKAPEKHNLYAGLANLAQGIQDLEAEMHQIHNELRAIINFLNAR
ncbi:MAG: hypothetical protein GYA46_00660 [candidate division Zixibacteria bacterium]|nr:hypothetical protein [candidate division Zixibacteria bacterium]